MAYSWLATQTTVHIPNKIPWVATERGNCIQTAEALDLFLNLHANVMHGFNQSHVIRALVHESKIISVMMLRTYRDITFDYVMPLI